MRATRTSISPSGSAIKGEEFKHWNSPIPYLFGGLGLMLALIAMALLILACSYKKPSPSATSGLEEEEEDEAKSQHSRQVKFPMEMEPKIVVIMAGEHNPTFLAKPLPSNYCTCQLDDQLRVY